MKTINRNVIKKIKINDCRSDYKYWQSRSHVERLKTLETIRNEYNSWKYDNQQGFQRVYSIIKPA
ncbi:MAG: hypothetical protein GY834_11645 [Bacteroidetes bacterium]|nr:hypothetical protein [Bacteroidota bacterium]